MLAGLYRLFALVGSAKNAKASIHAVQTGLGRLKSTAEGFRTVSFQRTRDRAAMGDAQALYDLGEYYYEGRGVPRDFGEACEWFEQSARRGHAVAQLNLGLMLWLGRGRDRDWAEAYKWLCLAADQGNEAAVKAREMARKKMPAEARQEGRRRARRFVAESGGASAGSEV